MKKSSFSKIKIKFIAKNKSIEVKQFKKGHIPEIKQFNFAIVNFGNCFDYLKNYNLPVSKRIKTSCGKLRVLAFEYPKIIVPALKKITKLANLPQHQKTARFSAGMNRFIYQQALEKIYKKIVCESWQEGINNTMGLLMERGALLTGAFYNYPNDKLIRITAKRLDYEDGSFGLGLSNLMIPDKKPKFKKLHIQEDCLATGDSIAGTIYALKKRGIKFNEVIIDTCVATQTGAEFIQDFLKFLNIQKITIRTGGLCYKLDSHYYLRRTKEEGYLKNEYYVGDMGEWSTILPKNYDKIAWWNKNRLDYKK